MKRHLVIGFSLVVLAALVTIPRAQMRVTPLDDEQGHVALGLALRHLANTGIYMMATAHPDDENNGLLVMLNRGQGYRTVLATATRGNGGQNEIGPELFEPLGVLRTEELAAMHRFDGAEQYFTRAVDFGYTIDVPETIQKWGRDEIVGDYVRLIRMVRPDVISAQNPSALGPGQHAHHALAAMLAGDAYKLAGDPTKYPEQIRDGLRPWQPKKLYFATGFGGGGGGNQPAASRTTRCDLAVYDSMLGRTYSEIGTEARSMHKCQGQAQLLALPGPSAATFQLSDTTIPGAMDRDEKTLFDGVDTSLTGLAKLAGPRVPRDLSDGLNAIQSAVQAAQKKFETETDEAALQPLLTGLRAERALRGQLRTIAIDDATRYEIDFRLRQKEREFQQAALAASGLRVEVLANDGIVVPGQPVQVSLIVANRGSADVTIKQVRFNGLDGDAACALTPVTAAGGGLGGGGRGGRGAAAPAAAPISMLKMDQVGRCDVMLTVPTGARVTEPYWHRVGEAGRYVFDADAPFGLPLRPTPFYVQITLAFPGGEEVIDGRPVQYRYEGNIFSGEKRTDLLVVPAFSVQVSPEIVIIPAAAVRPAATSVPARGRAAVRATAAEPTPAPDREIRVTVINDAPIVILNGGAAAMVGGQRVAPEALVKLQLPPGWTSTPAEQTVSFTRADESQTLRFQVRPSADTTVGDFAVSAIVSAAGQTFDRGFEVIEYPHIRRQHIYEAAEARLKVLDVRTAPSLTVGYIMGSGDEVPAVIEQLGAKVELIGPEGLAWGDLARFDTIVIGVRAYERRDDLRANNSRLLEYVRNGGTLIEQYNRAAVNDAFGPYPAPVSNNRITDERAPVKILEPANPIFTTPNRITDTAWEGWVQERGLNFLADNKDARYRDLVEMTDPFPYNPGAKRGALVQAAYGKGQWIYIALGLSRQLPAGTDGAYSLLANLISLGKPPAPPAASAPDVAPAPP
ncbi:MAG: PIG-L family deacetylase, partial [Vicinamibacterales bacterium]